TLCRLSYWGNEQLLYTSVGPFAKPDSGSVMHPSGRLRPCRDDGVDEVVLRPAVERRGPHGVAQHVRLPVDGEPPQRIVVPVVVGALGAGGHGERTRPSRNGHVELLLRGSVARVDAAQGFRRLRGPPLPRTPPTGPPARTGLRLRVRDRRFRDAHEHHGA